MSTDTWNPLQYDKFKNERAQPFLDLLNLLQPCAQARVIDLGCGTGQLSAQLHDHMRAKTTLGIDTSDQMLKQASTHVREGLSFSNVNIEKWDSHNEYDIVFSNAALQWCSDHPLLFNKLKNSLRTDGQLAVQMPMNHDYPTHILANQMSEEEPWVTLLGSVNPNQKSELLTPEDYAKLMFKLGFQEQKIFLRIYGHVLENRNEVIEWVKGTLLTYFKSRLNESQYRDFLKEYQHRLFEIISDEKPFFYPFKRILIWGRR